MRWLRLLSRGIDRINRFAGRATVWLILVSVLTSAINAVVRKAAGVSSNAWLEAQWYLYSAAFLGAAGYVLLVDEHVRIDAVAQRFSPKLRAWIDVVALLACILPLCALMIVLGWDFFRQAWDSGESSYNAGGLLRWPVYLTIPVGFGLLAAQALSELIKRVDFLRGGRAKAHDSEAALPPFLGVPPVPTRETREEGLR